MTNQRIEDGESIERIDADKIELYLLDGFFRGTSLLIEQGSSEQKDLITRVTHFNPNFGEVYREALNCDSHPITSNEQIIASCIHSFGFMLPKYRPFLD
jgi:hypothetical protein